MNPAGKRILVLDDAVLSLEFMQIFLTTEGFEVDTALSVDAALEALKRARPDLIITEALLPGLPAFAVLDILTRQQEAAGIPLVVCTGAVHELRARAAELEKDGVACLEKPFELTALLDCMAKLLGSLDELS